MPDNFDMKINIEADCAERKIKIIKDDIVLQNTDVIVNAANSSLSGGGGVDGAIHKAAGPQLLKECRGLGGCPAGEAKITRGYDLPCRYVVHTVGPVWRGGNRGEEGLLASCYRNSLKAAASCGAETISFPSISTGAYGFPFEKACRIALNEIKRFLDASPRFKEVRLVCFSQEDANIYNAAFREIS